MQEYVLTSVFCFYGDHVPKEIKIVHKDRPEWQKGKINLPGGKVEPGETPEQAAKREFQEEVGATANKVVLMGKILGKDCIIYCFHVVEVGEINLPRSSTETEKVEWMFISDLMTDKRLMPNLRVIIPLLVNNVSGWVVEDRDDLDKSPQHSVKLTLPTFL